MSYVVRAVLRRFVQPSWMPGFDAGGHQNREYQPFRVVPDTTSTIILLAVALPPTRNETPTLERHAGKICLAPGRPTQFQPMMPSPSTLCSLIKLTLRPIMPSVPAPRSRLWSRLKEWLVRADGGTANRYRTVTSPPLLRSPSRLQDVLGLDGGFALRRTDILDDDMAGMIARRI